MNDIGTVLSKDPKTMRVSDVIEILSKQPVEQKRLSEIHDKILKTLDNFKKYNEINANLIKESLEIIDFNLNLVTSLYQDTGISNYDRNAKSVSAMGAAGVFDKKS